MQTSGLPAKPGNAENGMRSGSVFPVITTGIVLACTTVFMAFPETIYNRLAYNALAELGLPRLFLVTLTSHFFHHTANQLWLNMVFLMVLGTWFESRLGPWRYLAVIATGGMLSSLINLNILISRVDVAQQTFDQLWFPPAGFSGSIAALMGVHMLKQHRRVKTRMTFTRSYGVMSILLHVGGLVPAGLFWTIKYLAMDGLTIYKGDIIGFLAGLWMAAVLTRPDGGVPLARNRRETVRPDGGRCQPMDRGGIEASMARVWDTAG